MIKLTNITKEFNDNIILNNINISLFENKIYLLKGISGSGKTTLLNIIGLLDREYSGDYYFNEENITSLNNKELNKIRNNIGYIFQKSLLIKSLNIKDNLLFINNDYEYILKLSKEFNIEHLLNKYPKELSGGERQRVALVRTLLMDTDIILLDEPTSSLDISNALVLVEYIEKLKEKNKIIIISTHSNIFDNIVDEILYIKDGSINQKENNNKYLSNKKIVSKRNNNIKMNIKYALSKQNIFNKLLTISLTSIVFLIILLLISLKLNFKSAYTQYLSKQYPINTYEISLDKLMFIDNNEIQIYYNYSNKIEEVYYLPLLNKEDSIFSNNKYLDSGYFPNNDNEVLVNNLYLQNNDNADYIVINNIKYKIVGVISSDNKIINDIYESCPYYINESIPQVFIPYNKIKNIYNKIDSDNIMISTTNKEVKDILNNLGFYNNFDDNINNVNYTVNLFTNILFIAIIFLFVILIFFITNNILLHLYYRKKEIGYLQIFNVSKKRIKHIILLEYSLKYILSIIISIMLYFITILFIRQIFGVDVVLNIVEFLLSIILFLIYIYIVISIPLSKYLKKEITLLIK